MESAKREEENLTTADPPGPSVTCVFSFETPLTWVSSSLNLMKCNLYHWNNPNKLQLFFLWLWCAVVWGLLGMSYTTCTTNKWIPGFNSCDPHGRPLSNGPIGWKRPWRRADCNIMVFIAIFALYYVGRVHNHVQNAVGVNRHLCIILCWKRP